MVGLELAIQTHVLPSTPFVKVLLVVCWATGKRLTNRRPKLNLITLYVKAFVRWATGKKVHQSPTQA